MATGWSCKLPTIISLNLPWFNYQIYLFDILLIRSLSFVFTTLWSDLPLLSYLISQIIVIIISGLNKLLVRKSFLRDALRSLVMNCTSWTCKNWIFYFVWSITIVCRRWVIEPHFQLVLHCFGLNVIHHWTISNLIFHFNFFIMFLYGALCWGVISNFQLLKLLILSTVRFLQSSLQVSTFWRSDSLLVRHYLLSITVQAICIFRQPSCFWVIHFHLALLFLRINYFPIKMWIVFTSVTI